MEAEEQMLCNASILRQSMAQHQAPIHHYHLKERRGWFS